MYTYALRIFETEGHQSIFHSLPTKYFKHTDNNVITYYSFTHFTHYNGIVINLKQ